MYPNPYQNQNPQGGYPPPVNTQPQQPQVYQPPVAGGYAPPTAYPPPGSLYQPQTAYQPPAHHPSANANTYPGGMMYPPPAPAPHQAPPTPGGYAPPAAYPPTSAYPPPSTAYSPSASYPPPTVGANSGNPYGATVTAPYGSPVTVPGSVYPPPSPYGVPTSVPAPQPTGLPNMPQAMPSHHQFAHQGSQSSLVSPAGAYPPSSTFAFRCGPLLRYQNLDLHQGNWIGSVMVVSKPEAHGQPVPVLTWSDGRLAPQKVTAQAVDGYNQSIFYRFTLVIPQDQHVTKKINYSIDGGPSYWFFVAGRAESFRWMFYSCNGFSSNVDSVALGGANPLWNDMLAKHTENPYHVMIGGGDQLYCDSLLEEKEMKEWLKLTIEGREKAVCQPHWIQAIENYYFNRYCSWFSQGAYGQALAAIPTVNMWDDHDTIDGYGSYPESTQKSHTMSIIGAVSRRFYLLFQHHSTPTLRTKLMVCSDQTYDLAFAKMYHEIPHGTRHLLVQIGVPIAYPRLVFAESLMGSVGNVLGSIAGAKGVVNKLNGEPELLDDLNDHWTAKTHKAERNKFLTRLQNFANDRKIRVTFISGDVHCAGVGRFTSKINPPEKDPQLMYQVISSAIVNIPPPDGVISLLHFQDKVHILEGRVKTYEDMYPMFTTDVDGTPLQNDKLLPRRNYSHGFFNAHTGSLEVTIFAENVRGGPEHTPGGDRGTKGYTIHVPRLEA
ncbi:hypothetical protein BGZ92_008646 [Podila epicladia]|nr:hypothetical protein BGZ92_008646 [Podila epicladia]